MTSSLLTELWRLKLSDMTTKFDDVIWRHISVKNVRIALKLCKLFNLAVAIFVSVHKVDRDLQKYCHLQMAFIYDVIDISLGRTIKDMVLMFFSAKRERLILLL